MHLRQYLEDQKIPITTFAKDVGVSVQAVHRYVSGERIPRREVMEKIASVTCGQVQANDFYVDAA